MVTTFCLLLLLVGFVILIKGANFFVDGASATAEHFRISKVVIGLTIVAFGTSAPELAVSFSSLLSGHGDILLGNVVGANIANILLILGVASLFATLRVQRATVRKEIPVMMLITVAFIILLADSFFGVGENFLTRQDGAILLLFFAIFIYYLAGMARRGQQIEAESRITGRSAKQPIKLPKAILMSVLGLAGIVIGGQMVVNSATDIATALGVSDKMISLTIIAIGTTLPELVTCVIAARKGETDIVIGNVVGSIIFNIGLVIGLPVLLIGGIPATAFSVIDLIVLFGSTVLLFILSQSGGRIVRSEGIVLLLLFGLYYVYTIANGLGVIA